MICGFPDRYDYPAMKVFPDAILSLERGRLFFGTCGTAAEIDAVMEFHRQFDYASRGIEIRRYRNERQ